MFVKIYVIITCYNRSEKTINCIEKIIKGNSSINFEFVIVDDDSTDSTVEQLQIMNKLYNNITVIHGDGNLFYSRGMRKGMLYILQENPIFDYILLANDDVDFFERSIMRLIEKSKEKNNAVITGATCSEDTQELTYGGIKYKKGSIKYKTLGIADSSICCDTFNANCVLIPSDIFKKTPAMDSFYHHSMGDFDYGLSLRRKGYLIYTSDFYVGTCNKNSLKNTWQDKELSIITRFKKKDSPKGAPLKTWFYFLKKNFGLYTALLHGFTPYIRILTKK